MGSRGRVRPFVWLMFLLVGLALTLAGTLAFVAHPAPAESPPQSATNASNEPKSPDTLGEGLVTQLLVSQYNDSIDDAPELLTKPLGGKRIQIRINRTDHEPAYYYVRTDSDGKIADYHRGRGPRPTIRILTDAATIERALDSNRPSKTLTRAYENGEFQVQGVGIVGKIQVLFLKAVITIVRLAGAI